MTIAERLTRPISIRAAGKDWPILFTHGALLDIERATGLDVMGGELNPSRPTARALRAILCAATGAPCEVLNCCFSLRRIGETRRLVWDAWQAAMPDSEPEAPDSKEKGKPLTWIEAWAVADQDLGLTADEWLAMTPRMVHALLERHLEQLRQWELLAGMVIANNANFSACAPKEPFSPERFMLHPWPKNKKDEKQPDLMAAFSSLREKGLIQRDTPKSNNRRR